MKKLFTLIAACIFSVMGAMAAEGDKTTNVDIDFSNSIVTSESSPKFSILGNVGSMVWDNQWTVTPNITDGILRFGNFTGSVELQGNEIKNKDVVTISFDLAFGKLSGKHVGFTLKDAENGVILTQFFDAYNGDFDNYNPLNLDWTYMYRGSNTVLQERCVYFTITLDYAKNTITTKTKCYLSGISKSVTNGSFEATLPSTKPIKYFELVGNINNAARYSTFDNLKIETTEGNYESATASYSIKYICNGVEIKTSASRTGDVGSSPFITNDDKEDIFVDGKKYVYESDNSATTTITADGNTVVSVYFKEIPKYNYTVNSNVGDLNIQGSGFKGDDINLSIPRYINNEGVLCETDKNYVSFKLNDNNQTETVEYNTTSINNVVFYSEVENIAGATYIENTAASNRQIGRTVNGAKPVLTTLSPGKYKISSLAFAGNGTVDNIYNAFFYNNTRSTTIGTFAFKGRTNYQTYTSEEITLFENSEVSFECPTGNATGVDYIYIVKTGDAPTAVSVEATEKGASFVTPCALDFTGSNIKAYVATAVSGTAITLAEVTKVPAGQAILVAGETSDVNVIASAEAPAVNLFKSGAKTVGAGENVFALSKADGQFHIVAEGVEIPEGKAYIVANTSAKTLTLDFTGEATGINSVATAKQNGSAYNLMGQKVSANAKGIVIINGKKYNK